MAIYEVGIDKLIKVEETSFGTAGLGERADLQRLLRDQVTEVSPDTLVIAEEFSEWTDSRRRIDLLGIDKEANLVVIELKRTDDGGHMELQAIRYAAMVSTLTSQRAVEIFSEYLDARGRDEDAEQQLLEFLEWDEFDEDKFAQDVRLVLVSADFSKELTSAVLWLNDKDLDICCVRIKPYAYEGKTLIDVQQVVPLPEAADYQVQVREKKRQERKVRRGTTDFTRYDVVVDGHTSTDFTRYDVVVDGHTSTAQWKRNAILLVVKGIVSHGVSPEEITQVLQPIKGRQLFKVVLEETEDPERFRNLATKASAAKGRGYDDRRWHTGQGELLVHEGQTYALTNQWGKSWLDAMKLLKKRFPQVELRWEESVRSLSGS